MEKAIAAKTVRGYCDFCGQMENRCPHCISMKDAGFEEIEIDKGEVFLYDEMDFFLILFMLSGETILTAPNGRQVYLKPNSMMLFSKSDVLRLTAQTKSHAVLFEFSSMPDFCEKIRLQYFQQYCNCEYDYTPTPMEPNVQTFLEECLFFMRHRMLCKKFSKIKQTEFFYLISVLYTPVKLAAFLHPIIGKAMDFKTIIMQSYSPSLTATDLIKRTSYGRNAFYKMFHIEFGMPVKEWIVKQRIKHMYVIAMESQMTAKEMMYRCGFSSSGNFAKFCKSHTGMTPTELIKRKLIPRPHE